MPALYRALNLAENLVDYRDGTNDQIVVLSADDWKNFIQNNVDQGIPESMFASYKKYITQDSMNIKEAVNFLKKKSPEKDEILKLLFGEENDFVIRRSLN